MLRFNLTEDLYLKFPSILDRDKLFKLLDANREHLGKWFDWVDGIVSAKDYDKFIKNSIIKYANAEALILIVVYKGEFAGMCGFNEINSNNAEGVIGYWLGKEFEGKGIMTKACMGLLFIGFNEFFLNRITIEMITSNLRSKNVALRLGMKLDGRLRQARFIDKKFEDANIYSILREEYELDN